MRIHRLLGWRDAREALHVAIAWKEIADRRDEEKKQVALEGARALREIVEEWRISLEQPEIDLREDLETLLRDLSDNIAMMEEHF